MVTRKRTKIQIPKYVLIDSEIMLSSYLYLQDGFKSVNDFFLHKFKCDDFQNWKIT